MVEETDPTKQGLKLLHQVKQHRTRPVEETDPTKQGLKPLEYSAWLATVLSRRDRSNKTRIETRRRPRVF